MTVYPFNSTPDIVLGIFEHKGNEFEMLRQELTWDEEFVSKRKLFSWVWEPQPVLPYVNKELKKLRDTAARIVAPPVIMLAENTAIVDDGTRKIRELYPGITAVRTYKTTISAVITKSFSEEIYSAYDGSRLVFIGNQQETSTAEEFRKNVESAHSDKLESLFVNGVMRYHSFNGYSFSNGFGRQFDLTDIGMAPLQNPGQSLGLLMAACDKFRDRIPNDQIWFIYSDWANENTGSIIISKRSILHT